MKTFCKYFLVAMVAYCNGFLYAGESAFDSFKLEFEGAQEYSDMMSELVVKDQTFIGSCIKSSNPSLKLSSSLFVFAPVEPFKKQVFVAQEYFDGDPSEVWSMDPDDLQWVSDTLRERSSNPVIKIENKWLWMTMNGFLRNTVRFVLDDAIIKSVIVRSDFTGDAETREIYDIDTAGTHQYCRFDSKSE